MQISTAYEIRDNPETRLSHLVNLLFNLPELAED